MKKLILLKIFPKVKFLLLLASIISLIFASPFLLSHDLGRWVIATALLIMLGIIVIGIIKERHLVIVALVLASIMYLSFILSLFVDDRILDVVKVCSEIIFYAFSVFIIFTRELLKKSISQETFFAAMCVYLLIGLSYATIYQLVELLVPNSFHIMESACRDMCNEPFQLFYFNMTVLTTTGFGDVIPISLYAKSVVIVEEITGVLFLAFFVSRLISRE